MTKNYKILILILFFPIIIFGQSSTNIDKKVLFRKEKSGYIFVHNQGWGLGYRFGKHLTYFKKRMFEFELTTMKDPKEKKIRSYYDNSKSFFYGKLNTIFMLRGGMGLQRIITNKPYWGGIEIRFFFGGGISLAIAKPVYLYIYEVDTSGKELDKVLKRYDPKNQSILDIEGRGPFLKGFDNLSIYPGAYIKLGFNFEYGSDDKFLKALETGIACDAYPIPVPIMAFNNPHYYFLTFYLALHFGKRSN